jgi:hypothetical protein
MYLGYREKYAIAKQYFASGHFNESLELLDQIIEEYHDKMHIYNYEAYRLKGDILLKIGLWNECQNIWINHTKLKEYEIYDRAAHFLFKDKRYSDSEIWYNWSIDYHLFPPKAYFENTQARIRYIGKACKRLGLIYRENSQYELAYSYMETAKRFNAEGIKRYLSALKMESKGKKVEDSTLRVINEITEYNTEGSLIFKTVEKNYDDLILKGEQLLEAGLEQTQKKRFEDSNRTLFKIHDMFMFEFFDGNIETPDIVLTKIMSLPQKMQIISSLIDLLSFSYFYSSFNLVEEGLFVEAESRIDAAIVINPTKPVFYAELGFIKSMSKKYDEAVSYYRRAIELDNTYERIYSGKAFRGLGFIYLLKGDTRTSKEMYIEALRINPEDETSMNELSWIEASEKGLLTCPQCDATVRLQQKRCKKCNFELFSEKITE